LEKNSFGVIIQLVRVLCEFYSNSQYQEIRRTLQQIICILKILSLYHKSFFAFTRFYDPYPGQLTKGNNLISFFKSLIELCKGCFYYFELLPFEIYSNLLIFLFPDPRSYQLFMYSIVENGQIGSNQILKLNNSIPYRNLINLLQENSIIHHALELISTIKGTKKCILAKITALKCLLLLTNLDEIMKIFIALKENIEEKIHSSLLGMIYCDQQHNYSLIFFRYAFKLVKIIEIHSKISDSCTFKNIDESPHFDKFYVMSLISQHCPNGKILHITTIIDQIKM
ncbi:hypothetical protein MXB_4046, partial [Myxobolus squamalis]